MAEPVLITDANDARVADFSKIRESRGLNHRGDAPRSQHNHTFIAEGRWVTQRLLESRHVVKSVLVIDGNQSEWQAMIEATSRPDSQPQLLVASKDVVQNVVGYDFHRGVIGCGVRPTIENVEKMAPPLASTPCLDVYLDGISDPENVGNILRTAAALGVRRIIIGPGTVDPFRRRVIRVSMASVFGQTFYCASDSGRAIDALIQGGHRIVATTLSDTADDLTTFCRDDRPMVLLLGNEASGISTKIQQLASDRLRVPMTDMVDSMNVASAAAIFMWRLLS